MNLPRPVVRDELDGNFTFMTDLSIQVDGWPEPFTIPAGFVTDFASTPRFAWWLFPRCGRQYDVAAAVHDLIYRCMQSHFTKKQADAALFQIMKQYGTDFLTRWCFYLMVRWFGKSSWDEDRH